MDIAKYIVSISALLIVLALETRSPLFTGRTKRWLHVGRNFSIVIINNVVLFALFSSVTATVFLYSNRYQWGLSYHLQIPQGLRVLLLITLFDIWMYVWHRLNHVIPFLWRFHRMHHSDPEMDVSTALRFHTGEIMISSALRLGIILLSGMSPADLLLYGTIMLPIIFLHHSNYYLPARWDKLLRTVIVTPWMHWVHHSHLFHEGNSNYGTIFSWWDRLAKTFLLREDPATIQYGLDTFSDPYWQTVPGMLKTPLASSIRKSDRP